MVLQSIIKFITSKHSFYLSMFLVLVYFSLFFHTVRSTHEEIANNFTINSIEIVNPVLLSTDHLIIKSIITDSGLCSRYYQRNVLREGNGIVWSTIFRGVDYNGKERIKEPEVHSVKLPDEMLSPGVYFYQIIVYSICPVGGAIPSQKTETAISTLIPFTVIES